MSLFGSDAGGGIVGPGGGIVGPGGGIVGPGGGIVGPGGVGPASEASISLF